MDACFHSCHTQWIRQEARLLLTHIVPYIALTSMSRLLAHAVQYRGIVDCLNSVLRYVRPRLSENGPLAIVAGRHPLLEQAQPGLEFSANDTYLSGAGQ